MKRLVGLTRGQRNNSKFSRACSGTSLGNILCQMLEPLDAFLSAVYIEQIAIVYSSSFGEKWRKSMVVIKASVGTTWNLLHAKYFHVDIWWRHSYPKGKKKACSCKSVAGYQKHGVGFRKERTAFHSAPKLCRFFGACKDIWDWNGKRGEGKEEGMSLWGYFCRKQVLLLDATTTGEMDWEAHLSLG